MGTIEPNRPPFPTPSLLFPKRKTPSSQAPSSKPNQQANRLFPGRFEIPRINPIYQVSAIN